MRHTIYDKTALQTRERHFLHLLKGSSQPTWRQKPGCVVPLTGNKPGSLPSETQRETGQQAADSRVCPTLSRQGGCSSPPVSQ